MERGVKLILTMFPAGSSVVHFAAEKKRQRWLCDPEALVWSLRTARADKVVVKLKRSARYSCNYRFTEPPGK
jgi:hypothetical protein